MDLRLQHEIERGEKIASQAGKIWDLETPAGRKRLERRVKMLTSHISRDMKVLEVGCGSGYLTKELVRTQASILAIDVSDDILSIARENVLGSNLEFRLENAHELSSAEDVSFDTIVGNSVLHHLDVGKALSEFYRILKPGGTLFFAEPNMLNPQVAVQKNIPFIKQWLGDSPDETAFFKWQIERLLQKHGFSHISVIPFDFLHPAIPEKFINFVSRVGGMLERVPIVKHIAGSLYISGSKGK
jgi:ubiquinone/menaquinone biosynthesis C-methylase UbiE